MKAMMIFMNSRTHNDLYKNIVKVLPQTFGFEFASVLFSEDSLSLYSLDGIEEKQDDQI